MTEEGLRIGQLVRSRAGRDSGTYFLVVGVKDRRWVMVADGRRRSLACPKKKNVKHLEVFPLRVPNAEERFAPQSVITDRAVAEAVDALVAELHRTGGSSLEAARRPEGPAGGRQEPEQEPEEDVSSHG